MPKYQLVEEVDAMQFTGDIQKVIEFVGEPNATIVKNIRSYSIYFSEGIVMVEEGEWLVKEKGSIYSYTDQQFKKFTPVI